MEELYAAFLNRIESDIYELSLVPAENEWIYAEWKQFFLSSIQLFKFPRASFDLDAENNFIDSKIKNSEKIAPF